MDEKSVLKSLVDAEDVAGKKAGVYAKLLTEPALAQAMDKIAKAHQERKQALLAFLGEDKK